MLSWILLNSIQQFDELIHHNSEYNLVFFKHSTRCGISSMALKNFERSYSKINNMDFYFLDLIKNREISNHIATFLNVHHESPQLILVRNKQVQLVLNHHEISFDELKNLQ